MGMEGKKSQVASFLDPERSLICKKVREAGVRRPKCSGDQAKKEEEEKNRQYLTP